MILMNSLPESYENWCDSFIKGRDIVKYDEVCTKLINREYRRKGYSSEGSNLGALTTRGKSTSRSNMVINAGLDRNPKIVISLARMSADFVTKMGTGRTV